MKSFKKFNVDNFSPRKSFKVKRLLKKSNKDLSEYKNSLSNSEKGINDEEVKKIKNYLKKPIFYNISELEDSLEFMKNEIIFKTRILYNLKLQIFKGQKLYNKYLKESEKENNINEKIIKMKSNELENIKEMNNNHKKLNFGVKQNILNIKSSSQNIKIDEQPKIKEFAHNHLFNKINNIYDECKLLKMNIKVNKKIITKNSINSSNIVEILYRLKYISQILDKLFIEIDFYKTYDEQKCEIIKQTKRDIDKVKKQEKTYKAKLIEKEKTVKLLKKIEERNNKIYFVSFRKVDKYNYASRKKSKKETEESELSFLNFNLI